MPEQVFIALGSNLGDRVGNVAEATLRIDNLPATRVLAVSSLYETSPVGKTDQPRFINAVLAAVTDLAPRDLLAHLLAIETLMGRTRGERWGPRLIDLDLLLHGDVILDEPGLTLPHPRMAERPFVLVPLTEIAPLARDPLTNRLWRDTLAALPAGDWGHRLTDDDG